MDRTFNLFVYGTLMRGFRSNGFIPEEAVMEKGKVVGNLYHYAAGYPIVQIPKDKESIEGTLDYERDLEIQDSKNHIEPVCLPYFNEYGCVQGELYEIPYSKEVVGRLDAYEGFHGDPDTGLYCRTLVPVKTDTRIIYAWIYNMNELPSRVVRVYSGDWRDCFRPYCGMIRKEIQDALFDRDYYEE